MVVLCCISTAFALDSAPILEQAEYRTGALSIKYSNCEPNSVVNVLISTDGVEFTSICMKEVVEAQGEFTVSDLPTEFEEESINDIVNGVTYWIQIQNNWDDELGHHNSGLSNVMKQTPPITTIIKNFNFDYFRELMEDFKRFCEGLLVPSTEAMDSLNDSIQALNDKLTGGVTTQANEIVDNFTNVNLGDGNYKYTEVDGLPSLTDGTENDLTFEIPITKVNGEFLYIQVLTNEQISTAMPFLDEVKRVISSVIWITFVVYLIQRFTPQFKA